MGRSLSRQETQVWNSDLYDDSIAPTEAAFETNPANLETDMNNVRSQLHNLLKNAAGNWWDDLNVPAALETGAQRGVNDLNTGLHAVEKKRVLRDVHNLTDVTVGGADNWVVLNTGELPAQLTAALGAVTSLGTVVVAHGGTFATHALTEVVGNSAVNPQNLTVIVDGATRDPILSSGRQIYGLLQAEGGISDGTTITDTTTTRVQISFVRLTAAGDDLEACPAADIQGLSINYCTRERMRLEDLNEQDFLKGAIIDVGAGAGTIDRQTAYTNQGTTAVNVVTNSLLDLEGAGLSWGIRDDLEAVLFEVVEGSAGGTSQFNIGSDVDEFDVDAAVSDFLNGVTVDSGAAGTTINLGVTANQIDSGGSLKLLSTSADLNLESGAELNLTDSYRSGSTWSLATGIALADSSAEWDSFELEFGEVSLLAAITAASNLGGISKTCAEVTADAAADVDIGGVAGGANLDAQLHDLSAGTFIDDHDVYVNGKLNRGGANAAANNDVYPGTSLANGQLKFEYKIKTGDQLCVMSRA